jgi:ElaA protein
MNNGTTRTTVIWAVRTFLELEVDTLYAVLKLRTDVFVVEQNCPYPELDDKDRTALHVLGMSDQGRPVAYARILPPVDGQGPAIGRVVVHPSSRGTGLGHMLMEHTLEAVEANWGTRRSRLSAQAHLVGYYAHHGYTTVSDIYLLDNIPHVDMELSAEG